LRYAATVTPLSADDLVSTAAERAALAALRQAVGAGDSVMERHCLRVFLILERLAALLSIEIDREVALCASFLFELGIYPLASTGDVYTTDGRRHAERILRPFGWPEARLRRCLDAVERHHQLRPQWSHGPEVELLRRADLVDAAPALFRGPLPRAWLRELFRQVPRAGLYRDLLALIFRMARERPGTMRWIFLPPRPPRS
jgi:hypothetical protein